MDTTRIDRFIETQPPEERIYAEWDAPVLNSLSPEDLAAVERLNSIDRYKICQRGDGKIKLLGANMLKNVVSFDKLQESSPTEQNRYITTLKSASVAGEIQIVDRDDPHAETKFYNANGEEVSSNNNLFNTTIQALLEDESGLQATIEANKNGGFYTSQITYYQSMSADELLDNEGLTQEGANERIEAWQLLNSIVEVRRGGIDGKVKVLGANLVQGSIENLTGQLLNDNIVESSQYNANENNIEIIFTQFPLNYLLQINTTFHYSNGNQVIRNDYIAVSDASIDNNFTSFNNTTSNEMGNFYNVNDESEETRRLVIAPNELFRQGFESVDIVVRATKMNAGIFNRIKTLESNIQQLKPYAYYNHDQVNKELNIHYHCFPANTATTIDIHFEFQDSSTKDLHDVVYIGNDPEAIKSEILSFMFSSSNDTIQASLNIGEYVDYVGEPSITISCSPCLYELANKVIKLEASQSNPPD